LGTNKTTDFTRINKSNVVYSSICKRTENWEMLFTHTTYQPLFQQTGVQPTIAQLQHNKLFCATMKAKQVVLPTRESHQRFKDFLDETFSKSTATKDRCLTVKNSDGTVDGLFQVAHTKGPGNVPYKDEYSGELLNMTSDMWHLPQSPNAIWPNFYNSVWLMWWYSTTKFSDRQIGEPYCQKCEGENILVPLVKVRGLCEKSVFDKQYRVGDDNTQGVYFQGERGTNITTKMKKLGVWETGPATFTMIHTSLEANHTIEVRRAWI
jgi:hypothetical protein